MAINLTRAMCGRTLGQSLRLAAVASGNSSAPLAFAPSAAVRCVSLKVVQPAGASTLGHDERNMALGREMSPHLTIYKPQLTSMLSITHRFMGMALTGYAAALGLGALVLPNDLAAWVTVIEGLQLSAPTLAAAKFTLAFPATYHTLNGVRHLCWDNGLFLQLSEVYTTGWLMLALSVVGAGGLAAL